MIKLYCIHGNLQQPSVWPPIKSTIKTIKNNYFSDDIDFSNENIWESDATSFADWATRFCLQSEANDTVNFLLGYSLGGRLALHALLESPEQWAGAVIVAADTGFTSPEERQAQSIRDEYWAKRFLDDPWDEVLSDWDQLPVFCDIPCSMVREEGDFSRQKIADYFITFSKSKQNDLSSDFQNIKKPPILFLSGEKDLRYCAIGQKFSRSSPAVSHQIINAAGHRVPWENTKVFSEHVLSFISQHI